METIWDGSVRRFSAVNLHQYANTDERRVLGDKRTNEQTDRQTEAHCHRVKPAFFWRVLNKLYWLTLYGHIKTGPLYSSMVIGTLVVDEWNVTFGTARRGLGGVAAHPVLSLLYQSNSPPTNSQCTNFVSLDVAL